ncbi:MAG: hypothetical protein J7K65_03735 [Planctomycetes bacterium]|nr:hypothetical protein [Planctomycetota bacterium]
MTKKVIKQALGDVEFCYEAGVCGFVLKRRIEVHGCHCAVIAPSTIRRIAQVRGVMTKISLS